MKIEIALSLTKAFVCWLALHGYITVFDVHMALHLYIIPVVKPTRCNNVSNLFILERYSTCVGRSFRPSSAVQYCTYSCQTDTAVCLQSAVSV